MDLRETYTSLGLAIGVGLLIGLQREQSAANDQQAGPASPQNAPRTIGGIRTYPLAGLAGAVCALCSRAFGVWFVGAGLVAILIPLALAYWDDLRRDRDRGITSDLAFLLTYLLGALAVSGGIVEPTASRWLLVASLGVAVTALLSLKRPLHEFVARLSPDDIYATVKFCVVAVIVLPLLPNRTYGPLDVLNPFHIGLMVVLIAGISFVGYVAIRALGPGRGLGLTGVVGGLVSSTAVTLALSGRAKSEPAVAGPCAMGVVLASTIMAIRVVMEVAVVNRDLLPVVALPMGALWAGGVLAATLLWLGSRREVVRAEAVRITNPFEVGSAVKFGLLFAVVLLVAKAAPRYFGDRGTYVAGALAGLSDVDAITLSMARLAKEGLSQQVAATTILIACGANTLVKAFLALSLGGWAFGRRVLLAFFLMLASGAAGALALWSRA